MLADKFYPLAVEEILYFYYGQREGLPPIPPTGSNDPVDRTLDALGEQLDERLFLPGQPSIHHFTQRHQGYRSFRFGSRLSVNLTLPVPERIIISKTKTPIFQEMDSEGRGIMSFHPLP